MRIATSISLVLSIAASSSLMAETTQQTITFKSSGQTVVGTLALPEGNPAPVVLLLHGFSGTRDELKTEIVTEGVFTRTALQLADNGYASLRIDFRGSGESIDDLTFAETTFDGQVTDAIAAIDYLKNSDQVKSDQINLIGWSQGGLVATAVAGRTNDLDAIALWAAVGDPKQTFGDLFGAETMQAGFAADANTSVAITLPWGAEIELNGSFFHGIENFDPIKEIQSWEGPLFVAQGTKDTIVLPENAGRIIEAHEGPEQIWIAEMDHVFNTFETSETLDKQLEATIAFLNKHTR